MAWGNLNKTVQEYYDFIIKHKELSWDEIVCLFNKQFNANVNRFDLRECIKYFQGNGNIKNVHIFTQEQNEWLKEMYPKYSTKELIFVFNQKFHCNTTYNSLIDHCNKRLNLRKNNDFFGQQLSQRRSVSIGTESINKDYVWIKVKDDYNGGRKNWKLKQIVVWEEYYGKIPEGYKIIFCDGNKQNFDINNLLLATPKEILHLISLDWYGKGYDLVKAGLELIRSEQVLVDLGAIKRRKGNLKKLRELGKK